MNVDPTANWSDEEVLATAKQLRVAYQLKRTLRYASTRDNSVHNESVAEHVFGLLYLAHYFLPFEDPQGKLNREKVYQMILFHDFGEIINGDIPYHIKTKAHEAQESLDAHIVFDSLPKELGATGFSIWKEYEEQQTPESRFVYALDKVEPAFELLDPISEQSLKRTQFSYDNHLNKKRLATSNFPTMNRFIEVMAEDMRIRKVFWEKPE